MAVPHELLRGDVDGRASVFPLHEQRATLCTLIEGDGEILGGRGGFRNLHVDASEIVFRAGISGTPFAGLLADDESPFIFAGNGEDCVFAGGNGFFSAWNVRRGDERGGFIGSPTPKLARKKPSPKKFCAPGAA